MKTLITTLITTVLFVPSTAFAAGFATVDASVIAMSAGGTGTARADDPAAAYYNPAAVAMMPGIHASIGATLVAPALSAESAAWSADTEAGVSAPPHLHLSWAGERLSLGASFTVPFGSRVTWPAGWAKRFEVQEAGLTVMRVSGFAGIRLGPVSLAAGPFVDFGSLSLTRAIDFIEEAGSAALDTRATGFGGQASLFWRVSPTLDAGLSYRSRAKLNFNGFADFTVPPEFSNTAFDQKVSTSILLPDRIAAGALWRVRDDLALTADLEVMLWSTVEELLIDFADERTSDVRQARNWRSTLVPRIGASWLALDWLRIRAGGFIDPSPAPKETVGPSSPDSTRLGLTAGASVLLPAGFEVAVAYQHLEFLGSTADEVRYSGRAELAGASVSWSHQ